MGIFDVVLGEVLELRYLQDTGARSYTCGKRRAGKEPESEQ